MKRNDPLSKFFISNNLSLGLFDEFDRILVAVSGGIDSMVLLDLLVSSGYKPGIAHVNYNLRSESMEDREFVVKKADELNLELFIKDFHKEDFNDMATGSIQMKARNLRYSWFQSLIEKHDYKFVLTAHHANDNIETMLYNLAKGTGIRGLRGMKGKHGKVIRPLLFASRSEILDYAESNKIEYIEDQSNRNNKIQEKSGST